MTQTISTYEQQAIDFLLATGTEFKAIFLKHGKHLDDDKDSRDIYEIELKRGNRAYKFNFGQSINCSGKVFAYYGPKTLRFQSKKEAEKLAGYSVKVVENKEFSTPTAYDVLACLTKYDPGTFENFCGEYGYDNDSRKAEKVYKAVVNEWQNVAMLFTDTEIEQLQEIQ